MIEKERFKELAKKEAIIYKIEKEILIAGYSSTLKIIPIKLDKDFLNIKMYDVLNDLFETEEEAEWALEFGNITRTETLSLPSWEEVYNDLKNYKTGDFYIVDNNFCSFVYDKGYATPQLFLYTHNEKYNWNATKENYIEACRLCKKLFKGEE